MSRSLGPCPALGLAWMLALAGCHDSTAPDSVDPTAIASGFGDVNSSFTGNQAFQSLVALPGTIDQSAATAALRAGLRRIGLRLAPSLRGSAGARALFPPGALGKTFVWDPVRGAYVPSELAGAPAEGVRFLLYVIDPETRIPALPLQALGRVDLTDRSSATADTLGVVVVLESSTVADYAIANSSTASSFALVAAGYLVGADGKGRVDFALSDEVGDFQTGAVIIRDHVSASNGFSVDLDVTGVPADLLLDYTVAHGKNSIELVGSAKAGGTVAEIRYNGVKVGTLSRSADSVTISGADGRRLSAQEVTALRRIFHASGELLLALQNVFAPGDLVF